MDQEDRIDSAPANTYDQGSLAAVSGALEFDPVKGATTNLVRGNVTTAVPQWGQAFGDL